jgi:ABC-2 type transport system permease protein
MAATLLALATAAFVRRDYGAALWSRRAAASTPGGVADVQHWWLRTWWTANLAQHRWGLVAWTVTAAAFASLMMALQPAVMDAWAMFDFMAGIMGGGSGESAEFLYTSFVVEIVAPVLVGFVIAQAAGWVSDLEQGRVESVLSAPLSWTQLVWERLVSASAGVAVVVVVVVAAVVGGSMTLDTEVDVAGIGRLVVMGLLLGWAIAALAAIAVVAFRSSLAVTLLAVYVGAAYLLTWMIPIFDWPAWLNRLSIFDAFGHPYQDWPGGAGLLVLIVLAVPGSMLAARIAEHTPKIA